MNELKYILFVLAFVFCAICIDIFVQIVTDIIFRLYIQ